ncbi:hypothetical protein Y032_0367g26 [Ancylostoma ceylanicum]|uniref:Uncharacterized protein n=1 Tax=Ancylostoma ceylanicum TaxID=53326 RepID=A0A016RUT4_9BILA|nr:hypothetical protein Y032_0367g26 [Ancylostoma ceylanicum]
MHFAKKRKTFIKNIFFIQNNENRHLAIEARSLCYARRYIQLNLKIIWWRKTCRRRRVGSALSLDLPRCRAA